MAEEVHTVYLLDKWAKMEARNQKRFITAVGGLTALELTRLVAKPRTSGDIAVINQSEVARYTREVEVI